MFAAWPQPGFRKSLGWLRAEMGRSMLRPYKAQDSDVKSPLHAASKERSADAHFRCALFDGHFEVVRHPHR